MKTKTIKRLCIAAFCLAFGGVPMLSARALECRTEAFIPVEVQTDEACRGAEYGVELVGTAGVPLPEQQELRFHGPDRLTFGPVTYTRPGIYGYLVREEKGTDPAILYDDTEYGVLVTVENDGSGGLQAAVVSFKWDKTAEEPTTEALLDGAAGAEKSEIIFRNRAVPSPTPQPDPGDDGGGQPQSDAPPLTLAAAPLHLFPQTGDGSLPQFWAVLMIASGIGFCLCGWRLMQRR